MSMQFDQTSESEKKKIIGIKNPLFRTKSGTNGVSHRRNAAKKKAQHEANRRFRADFYSDFQGEKGWKEGSSDNREWHSKIKALSAGTI
jgi:hypothetical protein